MTARKISGSCRCEALESRWLFAAGQQMQVLIDPKIVEVDASFANNLGVTFKLHDCNGAITFTGDNLAQQTTGKRITVTGTPDTLDAISLINTTKASSISVHTKGSQLIDLPSFTGTGPMKMIDISGVNLTDSMIILAAPKLVLGNGQDDSITISNAPGVFNCSIKGNNFSDTQLTCTKPISAFNVDQWAGSDASITSNGIKKFTASTVDGDFALELFPLNLPSSIVQLMKLADVDTIGPGTWTVQGAVGSIKTFSTDPGWTGTFGRLDHLMVKGTASGSLTTGQMKDLKVGGDMLNFDLSLTNPFVAGTSAINSIKIGGNVVNSNIDAVNSVRSFTADSLNNSHLFVGVGSSDLPAQASDFANTAELHSAKIGGARGRRLRQLGARRPDDRHADP
jgi:hypothetical protein